MHQISKRIFSNHSAELFKAKISPLTEVENMFLEVTNNLLQQEHRGKN